MQPKAIQKKLNILLAIVTLVFVILYSRLGYMQILKTAEFQTQSEENRIRLVSVHAPRGEILDRNNIALAKSRPVFTVSVVYLGLKNSDSVAAKLAKLLGMPVGDILKAIKENPRLYEPVAIAKDVPLDVVTKIEEHRMDLPGVVIDIEPMRYYPKGQLAGHVVGYAKEISDQQLKAHETEGYLPGDIYGQAGLERWFQDYLKGKDGARQVEVDASGRPVKELGIKSPVAGNDLKLTLNSKIQAAAEASLESSMAKVHKEFPDAKAGAVVLIDVKTGAVLAMASRPGYDPNKISGRLTKADVEALFSSKGYPAFPNRAVLPYAPGSTFKMVTGTAALETGKIKSSTRVYDPGYYMLGNRAFHCWKLSGHGSVNLIKAIQVSCNTYFFTLAQKAGNAAIAKYAKEYGLGEKTGITLPEEQAGRVPTPESKKQLISAILERRYKYRFSQIDVKYDNLIKKAGTSEEKDRLKEEKAAEVAKQKRNYTRDKWEEQWQAYDTLNMSIGQGNSYYTPLQLANYVATIANGGTRYKPYLVQQILAPNGTVIKDFKPEVIQKVDVSQKNLALLREGMKAVTDPGGTAYSLFNGFPVKVAAKTGTAQVSGKDNHGLTVAFAPAENPQVAVAAIIEHGGHGGSSAGLVVRDVLASYFGVHIEETSGHGVEE